MRLIDRYLGPIPLTAGFTSHDILDRLSGTSPADLQVLVSTAKRMAMNRMKDGEGPLPLIWDDFALALDRMIVLARFVHFRLQSGRRFSRPLSDDAEALEHLNSPRRIPPPTLASRRGYRKPGPGTQLPPGRRLPSLDLPVQQLCPAPRPPAPNSRPLAPGPRPPSHPAPATSHHGPGLQRDTIRSSASWGRIVT